MRAWILPVVAFGLAASPLPASDGRVATITTESLQDYDQYPATVKALIQRALELTRMNLRYTYGSADPARGGMDCSGTIHRLLLDCGIRNVPRQANTFYIWVWKNSRFHSVVSPNLTTFEFQHLKPGDLLFWSGTYAVDRDPPVTHVMLYLGKLREGGRPVMFGASSGRRYEGVARDGVSVFDFVLPKAGGEGRFLGYASIPGLEVPEAPTAPEPTPTTAPEAPAPRALPVEPGAPDPATDQAGQMTSEP